MRRLERIEIPGEHEARLRTWEVVRAAFDESEAQPKRVPLFRPLLVAVTLAAIVAAALSPAGRAVLDSLREAIERERVTPARPTLFSLPVGGRVLVNSTSGPWVVRADGSRRLLGRYRQASWSPRGLFVVATGVGETGSRHLYAIEPGGKIRWSLARPAHIRFPRWAPSGFRIAYLAGSALRVVAGDSTGDSLIATNAAPVAPVWRPSTRHVLAYVHARGAGTLRVVDVDARGSELWSRTLAERPVAVDWSSDAKRLLVVSRHAVTAFDASGRLLRTMPLRPGTLGLGAEFAPRGHAFALRLRSNGRSQLQLVDADRTMRPRQLFTGLGAFGDIAWSPDGRWLLVDWLAADQWLFIRTRGRPKIVAVSNVGQHFESPARAPRLLDWCCP
jgi:dipeptidyl aminopeptidase/acylaminoacyl peptidase